VRRILGLLMRRIRLNCCWGSSGIKLKGKYPYGIWNYKMGVITLRQFLEI